MEIYEDNSEYILEEFKSELELIQNYLECKKENSFESKRDEILEKFRRRQAEIKLRLMVSATEDCFFAVQYIKKVFELTDLEWFGFIVAMMFEADLKYRDLINQVENSSNLTYNTIFKLYFFVEDISEIEGYYSMLSIFKDKMNLLCFMEGIPKIDPGLFENVMNNAKTNMKVMGTKTIIPNENEDSSSLVVHEEIAQKIQELVNSSPDSGYCILIDGVSGIGRKTIVERVAQLSGRALVCADASKLSDKNFENEVMTICREAGFLKAWLCFYNLPTQNNSSNLDTSKLQFISAMAPKFADCLFVVSEKKVKEISQLKTVSVHVPELSSSESIKLWKHYLKDLNVNKKLKIEELVNKFKFTPKQIKNTATEALNNTLLEKSNVLNEKSIADAAKTQISEKLAEKATHIKNKHTWNELVLSPKEKEIIKRACDQIKYRHVVYDKWNFGDRVLYGRGLSMLFAGSSGTGKTMAAQVVSNELGLELYKVDLSRVISKYIGESEKNLSSIFDAASESNVILLFDEMDALFSKRTEVKDSHDRNANLETSYLLQRMEEYSGIPIMPTNFLENIDKAFFRRINYVVHFVFPDAKARKEIWQKMFPKKMPLDSDVDFDFLAKQFEISGGNIKNVVMSAAFMAASENEKVGMKHIIKSLEYEIKKQGKMVSKEDFAHYGYLI